MKKLLTLVLAAALCVPAFAQDNGPRPSPAASVSTTVGTTDVSITYFRPQAKGRKIFGDGQDFVVPFGKLWRTGANDGTIVTFANDVKVAGKDVPKGKYLILSIPDKSQWTLIFYTEFGMGDHYDQYDDSKAAFKFTVPVIKLSSPVEALTFNISDLSQANKSANIEIEWADTAVKLAFTAP